MVCCENTFSLRIGGKTLLLGLQAHDGNRWIKLPLQPTNRGCSATLNWIQANLTIEKPIDDSTLPYHLSFTATRPTRLRLSASRPDAVRPFHLIPGNIHGDNNAPHVAAGQF